MAYFSMFIRTLARLRLAITPEMGDLEEIMIKMERHCMCSQQSVDSLRCSHLIDTSFWDDFGGYSFAPPYGIGVRDDIYFSRN